MICCYLPSHESKLWNKSLNDFGIEILKNCLQQVYDKINDFHIMLMGDFNARTGLKNGCDLLYDFNTDTPDNDLYVRSSQDKVINSFGEQLIEFCSMFDCIILNGLSDRKFDDSCSFISPSGSINRLFYYVKRSF